MQREGYQAAVTALYTDPVSVERRARSYAYDPSAMM